jgi:hypothetical protein
MIGLQSMANAKAQNSKPEYYTCITPAFVGYLGLSDGKSHIGLSTQYKMQLLLIITATLVQVHAMLYKMLFL